MSDTGPIIIDQMKNKQMHIWRGITKMCFMLMTRYMQCITNGVDIAGGLTTISMTHTWYYCSKTINLICHVHLSARQQ